ncbi:MAG: hypothetical protein J5695_05515 [Bacteroidales bacterium]|nr:hypothetical protein [Bacteroidales bacterium]
MMKRLFALILIAASLPLAAQNGPEAFKALVDSNRVSFKYSLSAKDKAQIRTDGSVLIDGNCYHIATNGADIWCDGTTRWTVDSEAKEVYIESSDGTAEFFVNPQEHLDRISNLKVGEKSISGIYKEPSQGAEVVFKFTSIVKSPLSGSTAGFGFSTAGLGKEWVITDLR